MKYLFENNKKVGNMGMTLLEVLIYSAMVSMLLSGFIVFVYAIHIRDVRLIQEINDAYDISQK